MEICSTSCSIAEHTGTVEVKLGRHIGGEEHLGWELGAEVVGGSPEQTVATRDEAQRRASAALGYGIVAEEGLRLGDLIVHMWWSIET